MVGPFDATAVREIYVRLEKDAIDQLRRAGAVTNGSGNLSLIRSGDMKYKGQVHDVSVPVPAGEYTAASALAMADRFHERYESRYGKGTTNKNAPIEALSFEVRVAAKGQPLRLAKEKLAPGAASPTRGRRKVYFRETKGFTDTPIFDREALRPGQEVPGPAVIEAPDTTMLVRPGQSVRMDEYRNLTLSFSPGRPYRLDPWRPAGQSRVLRDRASRCEMGPVRESGDEHEDRSADAVEGGRRGRARELRPGRDRRRQPGGLGLSRAESARAVQLALRV